MTPLRNTLMATIMCLTALIPSAATAQETLPFEIELSVAPVEIELNDSLLEVTVISETEPLVRARDLEGAVGEPATFTVEQGGGRIRIARTPSVEGTNPRRAIVELALDPNQPLHVIGRDIMLVVQGPGRDGSTADQASPKLPGQDAGQAVAVAHTYELLDSEADLSGIPSTTIVAENTAVHSEGSFGELAAQLRWAGLTIANHAGGIRIASTDSETTVDGFSGTVEFEVEGGGVRLVDGTGPVQGKINGGFVATDRWNGIFSLGGTDSSFELRDGSFGQLKITSSNSVTVVDEIRGNVTIEATGGQITMDSVQGNLTVAVSDGGQVVTDLLYGALVLNLRDDAYGEVNRSSGSVTANVSYAELKVTGAKSLDLTSEGSRLTLDGLEQLTKFEARQSEVELDLRAARDRKLTLSVDDGTSVDLHLASPCMVQVRDSNPGGSGINVTGCELQMQRSGRWKRGRLSSLDGRPPFVLTARVADTGSLRVRGGP